MHIASYATGTKREKKEFRQKEKFKFVCAHSGIELTTLSVHAELVLSPCATTSYMVIC
jgi:hypothetical protein